MGIANSRIRRLGMAIALALCAATLIVGCAKQYNWYRCGCDCVDYEYHPPGPLPYTPYGACPTPIAECYTQQLGQSNVAPPPGTPQADLPSSRKAPSQ